MVESVVSGAPVVSGVSAVPAVPKVSSASVVLVASVETDVVVSSEPSARLEPPSEDVAEGRSVLVESVHPASKAIMRSKPETADRVPRLAGAETRYRSRIRSDSSRLAGHRKFRSFRIDQIVTDVRAGVTSRG